jgi:O-antigen ligase
MVFNRNKEFIELLLYLLVAIVLVYLIPAPVNKVIFLGFLPIIWKTKRDYLWLVFFFILEDIPGGLFSGGLANDPYRLPLYTIMPGISFSIREIYLMLLFIKVLIKPEYRQKLQKNYFSKELSLTGYYLILLLFISALLGMTFDGYKDFYKLCISLTLFISIPAILRNRENLMKFLNILFPFAIIAILLQVYSLSYGQQLIAVFKPSASIIQGILSGSESTEQWQRPIEMAHVLLVCFTGSLVFLNKGERFFKPGYLVVINLLSFLGIFLTGTRTWFLALIILYIYFFLTRMKQMSAGSIRRIIIASVIIIGISFIPVIRNQTSNAWNRLSTLEKFAEGDITAGGTSSRFDVRAPKVMEGFKSSTIIVGAGFSELFYQYRDGHVGYNNILLNAGIIGMILFMGIIAKALFLPYKFSKSKILSIHSKNELRASILLLVALLVINIGSQMIGYTPEGSNRFLLMVLALTFINQAINKAMDEGLTKLQLKSKNKL